MKYPDLDADEADYIDFIESPVAWQTKYPLVTARVRLMLRRSPDRAFTTTELVNLLLWPKAGAESTEAAKARARLFRIVQAIAKHDASDCVTRGPVRSVFGRAPSAQLMWKHPGNSPATIKADMRSVLAKLATTPAGSPEFAELQRQAAILTGVSPAPEDF
jgi:hypothetical protein